MHGIFSRDADNIFDLLDDAIRISRGQVDLVEDRRDFHPKFDSGIAVSNRLRLNTLRGIDHQQCTFTGGERT